MAQREPRKQKSSRPASAKAAASAPADAVSRLETRALAAERERDALKAELETARGRIAELERSRDQVADRIDWVIDSLHNLLEPRA